MNRRHVPNLLAPQSQGSRGRVTGAATCGKGGENMKTRTDKETHEITMTSETQQEGGLLLQLWLWWHTATPTMFSVERPDGPTELTLSQRSPVTRNYAVRRALCDMCQRLTEPSVCETKYRDDCLLRNEHEQRLLAALAPVPPTDTVR